MRVESSQATIVRMPDIMGTAPKASEEGRRGVEAEVPDDVKVSIAEARQADKGKQGEGNEELVKSSDSTLENKYHRFEISVHEATNKVMVKVVDKSTDEVIREIPPEKILDLVAKLWEMAGLFVDEKI